MIADPAGLERAFDIPQDVSRCAAVLLSLGKGKGLLTGRETMLSFLHSSPLDPW